MLADYEIIDPIEKEFSDEESQARKILKEAVVTMLDVAARKRKRLHDRFEEEWGEGEGEIMSAESDIFDDGELPMWAACARMAGELSEDMIWVIDDVVEACFVARPDWVSRSEREAKQRKESASS